MDATLPAVAEELLNEISSAFKETSQIPDELLLALKFVFGSSAVQALDLVDQRSVTRVLAPSGRVVYQVVGSSGKLYTCFNSCHYCSCPAFAFSVLRKSDTLLCKHLLAVYLSQAMGMSQELSVSDKQMTSILLMEEDRER
ncbi:zinc finger SWIM domain-containing protein 7 [Ornithorhynchus anatinus]|uniref:zinc finger SWIM domain-containing protein 7 n=1 Tax=Ornithorhynchus anatinus TaxID=9258 RepID=UPI0002240A02|nr:zinc finger SWIM domain-containing protein 7 [Ornithorhynchus anatinus]XP_028937720.1 zinc finger SWIM domain-containing protein 7 [Ornithorhynchus anatinus]XP_028937721.1 zinc finger SWIM domain-containing protein 7 [Ornithorhynchus anatinus]